jgi:hypothetical protein
MISNNFRKSLAFLNDCTVGEDPAEKTHARPEVDPAKTYRVLGQDITWNPETQKWHGTTFALDDATVRQLLDSQES